MIGILRRSALGAAIVFFAVTSLLAFGIGLTTAASSRGVLRTDLPESVVLLLLVSPTIAAVLLSAITGGWRGLHDLFSSILIWRVPVRWYLLAVLLPTALNLSAIGLYVLLGGSLPTIPGSVPSDLDPLVTGSTATTIGFVSFYFFLASLAEEIGWRGYALPLLQSRMSALSSSLLIGVVWAFWHVPSMFLLDGATQASIPFHWYLPSAVAISVLFTWLYNNTRGSLLLATLLHASIPVTNILVPILPSQTGTGLYALSVLVTIGVSATIVAIYGSRDLSRSQSKVTNPRRDLRSREDADVHRFA